MSRAPLQLPNSTATLGTIVQAITARFDAATASGEWPDQPLWQQQPQQQVPDHARAA